MEENELIEQLIPAVEEQIKSKDTPYVNKHYERLLKLNETEHEAKKLIAFCLLIEANRVMLEQKEFDSKNYQSMLEKLPELPE